MAQDDARTTLHAPFRPIRARRVALTVGVAQAVTLCVLAVVLPQTGPGAFQWYDRLGVVLVAGLVGWLMVRFAQISLLPREDGVTVRNLLLTRRLEWAEIVSVRFGGGAPWVTLDLADTDTVSVLAIQRADGGHGEAEARRLATLVELHSRTPEAD